MNKKIFLCFLASLAFCLCSCSDSDHKDNGGGGGGGGDNPNATACEELGIKSNEKIINGLKCNKSKSAVAELNITTLDGNTGLCTGTVISADTVLTAGHCFNDGATAVKVKVGGKTYDAVQVIVHPSYAQDASSSLSYYKNDLALVKVSQAISIAPIPIITSRGAQNGETLIVAGYGRDENNQHSTLKAAYMVVRNTKKQGFVLAYDDTHTNVCFGDSGGPAFGYVNGVLGIIGTVSYGINDDCLAGDETFFPGMNFSENSSFILANASPNQI